MEERELVTQERTIPDWSYAIETANLLKILSDYLEPIETITHSKLEDKLIPSATLCRVISDRVSRIQDYINEQIELVNGGSL